MGCISTRQAIVNNSIPKDAQNLIKEQVRKVLTQTQSKHCKPPSIIIEANIQITYSNTITDKRKSSLKKGSMNIRSKNSSVVFIETEKKQNSNSFNTKENNKEKLSMGKLMEPINKQLNSFKHIDKFFLKGINNNLLFKILEYTVNLKEIKTRFMISQSIDFDKLNDEDNLIEFKNMLKINKRISSMLLIYVRSIRDDNFDKIKNKTIIATKLNINKAWAMG